MFGDASDRRVRMTSIGNLGEPLDPTMDSDLHVTSTCAQGLCPRQAKTQTDLGIEQLTHQCGTLSGVEPVPDKKGRRVRDRRAKTFHGLVGARWIYVDDQACRGPLLGRDGVGFREPLLPVSAGDPGSYNALGGAASRECRQCRGR